MRKQTGIQAQALGRITSPPQLSRSLGGVAVCRFTVATEAGVIDKEAPVPTMTPAPSAANDLTPSARLDALCPAGRLRAYERGELSRVELWLWANRFPEEVPLVNGELPWIALRLADLD